MRENGVGNVALVLLAAGDSRRFHGNKLLSIFQGKAMYRHIVDQVSQLPEGFFCRKILVTQYPEIAEDLGNEGYEVVENHESHLGISHSIHLALKTLGTPAGSAELAEPAELAVAAEADAVCFAVCDQPWLRRATIEALFETWEKSGQGLACLCHQGNFGNPAVFERQYWAELMELQGDVGGKRVLRRHLDDLCLCEVEDGKELVDIDVRQ